MVHPFGKLHLSNKYIYNYIYTREELFNIDYSLELSYPHLSWVTFSLVKEDTIMRSNSKDTDWGRTNELLRKNDFEYVKQKSVTYIYTLQLYIQS